MRGSRSHSKNESVVVSFGSCAKSPTVAMNTILLIQEHNPFYLPNDWFHVMLCWLFSPLFHWSRCLSLESITRMTNVFVVVVALFLFGNACSLLLFGINGNIGDMNIWHYLSVSERQIFTKKSKWMWTHCYNLVKKRSTFHCTCFICHQIGISCPGALLMAP